MIKKTLMAAAVASAMVSASANAALTLQSTSEVTFANDLFSSSDLILGASGVNLVYQTDAAIAADADATFTFTLDNGTFGANPALTATGGTATITLTAGGQGSSTATFTVANSGAFSAGAGNNITLTVPSIAGADLSADESTANVTLAISGVNVVTNAYPVTATQAAADKAIAKGSPAITTSSTAETLKGVEVSGKTTFSITTSSTTEYAVLDNGFDVVVATGATAPKKADGVNAFELVAADTITYTLSGALAENAEICIVPNGETDCENEKGVSTVTTSGASIVLTSTEALALAGTEDIIYVVDGESNIPLTDFSYAVTAQFDSATLGAVDVDSNSGDLNSLGLYGLIKSATINIITNVSNPDAVYVRATNDTSSEATVYVQLTGQDGSDLGYGALPSIAAGATVVYTSDDFATASGSETWAGRARATINSDTELTLVPLIRTNDVLTNQSGSVDVD
jgi:hypothetical protein